MAIPKSKRKACPATRRVFVPEVSEEAPEVVLRGPQKRYVRDVLRMGPGDSLVLFDGSGIEFPSAITEATRRHVKVRILGRKEGRRESPIDILIGIGLLKTNKMDWVIQKVSELGVREVHPFAAHRTVPALDPERAEKKRGRWQTIAREASRQSGRSTVADVRPVLSFDEIVTQSESVDLSLIFTTEAISPLEALAQQQIARPHRMLLLVGPEGGFSPEEEQIAVNQGFLPVGLGPRVLRAETAAILAVGLVQYRFGDLGGGQVDLMPQSP
jgi:16S rRNA (uracil1498-N3)-methyltransferase